MRKHRSYGKRRCHTCPCFVKASEKKPEPGYIGICSRYRIQVKDALCGCSNDKDGKVTLWNFGGYGDD